MTAYATLPEVVAYAKVLGIDAPAVSVELIEAASRDVDIVMNRRDVPIDALAADARGALSRATAAQCLFRIEQGGEATLGADDGLASVAGVSFSLRPAPRWSALVVEELTGFDLLRRSGCALPDPLPVRSGVLLAGDLPLA